MTRPRFLDRPAIWTRTPRTSQSQVDYACPLEAYARPVWWRRPDSWVLAALACVCVVLVLLLLAGALPVEVLQ